MSTATTTEIIVSAFEPVDGINGDAHRRENHGLYRGHKLIDLETQGIIVDARIYYPATVCYACVWISDRKGGKNGRYANGSGRASGMGYHKSSAALYEAMVTSGVTFAGGTPWGGRGDEAETEALTALGAYLGYENTLVVTMYP